MGLRRIDSPVVDALSSLFFSGDSLEMVSSEAIRASNAAAADYVKDFVAVFVGGTGGIGESTAMELFKRSVRPRIYIVGR